MRPDEHKQKKNTQYKKKHGIKTGKGGGEETKSGDRRGKPPNRKDDQYGGTKRTDVQESGAGAGPSQARAKRSSDSSDSDTGSGRSRGPVYERKSFSRRQIVSNWTKYDLPDTGETSSQARGEDFNMLLASAGDALAQFRFKDEQDWEDSSPLVTETSKIISLDCQSLANAVECMPLYRRLGVDKDNFTENQIILQDLEAQKRQEIYDSTQGQSTGVDIAQSITPTPASQDSAKRKGEISLSFLAKPSVSLDFTQPHSTKDEKQVVSTVTSAVRGDEKQVVSTVTSAVRGDEPSASNNKDASSLDEDLDFLLSLGVPNQSDKRNSELSIQKDLQGSVVADQSNTSEGATAVELKIPKEEKSGGPGKKEDLEDWLDSVLGD